MCHIRMRIIIILEILVDLSLRHSGIAGKFQTVRIVNKIPSVFGEIIRHLVIGTVRNLRDICISPRNAIL